MKRESFRFFHRLRVRWAEVDMQKIVFNGHYLLYMDTAVADYWRALALPYEDTMRSLSGDLYVKKSTLEYHASAQYDDLLDIGMSCSGIGNSSMRFTGAVFREEQLLVSGELVYVFADPATQTSRPVPDGLRSTLTAYEAGEPMLRIVTGSWTALGLHASSLRQAVFVHEQGVPQELEWDDLDHEAIHAVAYNRLDHAVACGRLLQPEAGVAKVGRLAVHRALRGGGVGKAVLQALTAIARERQDREIRLHAQTSARDFYARQGYGATGEVFDEAGIPHVAMHKALRQS